MSLYQHAQPIYGGHPYPPPPATNYLQHAQPPVPYPSVPAYPQQPQFPMQIPDPSTFRRDYAARLSELTINSRPIIQNLSMMAQNFVRYADIVAECLQAHIRRVPPWMKLPAFYVLDAISKNVYDPYASKFSAFVVPLFLETFGQVDQSTRSKMEEMLVTWRTGAPNGKELFGVAAQVSLERQIWGNDTSSNVDSSSRRHGQAAQLTKSQVLAELDVTLALKEQAYNLNSYDTTAKNQVNVLHQLRRMVESGVSQEELQQILLQLRAMGRETAAVLPPPQSQPIAPPLSLYSNGSPQHPFVVPSMPQQYTQPSASQPSFTGGYQNYNNSFSDVHAQASTSSASLTTSTPSVAPVTSGITDLFKSLVKAGLVSANSTPLGAGSSSMATPPPTIVTPETPDEARARTQKKDEDEKVEAQRVYARSVLSMKIRLTTADISRQRPQNVASLYGRLSVRCKQCAIRFPDGPVGKKKMEDHLDMHFRQNRRAKEGAGRGHSRSWFVSVDDWISDQSQDVKGKGKETLRNAKGGYAVTNEAAEREAALKMSFVIVPPGDEAKSINCPVCKETLKSEFQEEDEEWVWRNAVRVKDKIYHATCHAEMLSSSTLAAKLRSEGISLNNTPSRAGTPDYSATSSPPRSTPPKLASAGAVSAALKAKLRVSKSPTPERMVAGTKRKAEGNLGAEGIDGIERTPPLKKLAVPAA